MADEVNQAAFEGGDTAPGTKEAIHERNKAMQEYVDTTTQIANEKADADQRAYDATLKAENAVFETLGAQPGAPVGATDMEGVERTQPEAESKSSVSPKK